MTHTMISCPKAWTDEQTEKRMEGKENGQMDGQDRHTDLLSL